MSAEAAKQQLNAMLDDLEGAVSLLQGVEEKLESLEGGAILLGLSESQNASVTGLIQVVEAAKRNRDTLWRFMFNIRVRIDQYISVL